MKTTTTIFTFLAASRLLGLADEPIAAEVLNAARQLSQEKSYAWISTSSSAPGTHDLNQGPTHGITQKDGFAYITFQLRDSTIELSFFHDKSAIKWADKWHGMTELKDDVAWIADRLKSYKFAADEAAFLVTQSSDLRTQDQGEFVGTLNDEALRFLLSRGRREVENVADINGSIRFRVGDGKLQEYEYTIRGPVPYGRDGALVPLDRTTVVKFKDVGNAEVTPPPEAVEKLR